MHSPLTVEGGEGGGVVKVLVLSVISAKKSIICNFE